MINFDISDLERALECLQREDPSLHVRTDTDTGQVKIQMCGAYEHQIEKPGFY